MSDIRAVRCKAMKRNGGDRCKNPALRGSEVCLSHGARLPAVREAARKRVALHEALQRGDRRPPWAILNDASHKMDVLMREAEMKLSNETTPTEVSEYITRVKDAAVMAKIVIDTGAYVMETQREVELGQEIANAFLRVYRAMDDADLTPAMLGVLREAMKREMLALDAKGTGSGVAIEGKVVIG